MPGLGRAALVLATALALLLVAGCGGGGADEQAITVPCNDTGFRNQDEELYVTQTAVSNARGGQGDPKLLLLDLRRARNALAGYIEVHPPCADDLADVAATEHDAIASLDDAIDALSAGEDAGKPLDDTLAALGSAQKALSTAS
jgi:hypothetical protein